MVLFGAGSENVLPDTDTCSSVSSVILLNNSCYISIVIESLSSVGKLCYCNKHWRLSIYIKRNSWYKGLCPLPWASSRGDG